MVNNDGIILYQPNSLQCKKSYELNDPIQYDTIPKEVLELLWFKDGKFKNYHNGKYARSGERKGLTTKLNFPKTDKIEPSLISIRLPLGGCILPYEKIDYFPNYSILTPIQRSTYLEWLKDITQHFDIGYVFLFFYGLERFMYLTDKFEEAFLMIIKLRKYHKNKSFQKYSSETLIAAAIYKQKWDLLKLLFEIEEIEIGPLSLGAMTTLEMSLTCEQILSFRRKIGFLNDRYIKRDNQYFMQMMKKVLLDKYGEDTFPLRKIFLEDSEKHYMQVALNRSLEQCYIKTYHLFYSNLFKDEIYSVLYEAHQKFKKTYEKYRVNMGNQLCVK